MSSNASAAVDTLAATDLAELLSAAPRAPRSAREAHDEARASWLARTDGQSPLERALPLVLDALDWRGRPREIVEALPRGDREFDLIDVQNVLGRLGFASRITNQPVRRLTLRDLPAVAEIEGTPVVIVDRDRDELIALDGDGQRLDRSLLRGRNRWRRRPVLTVGQPVVNEAVGANWFISQVKRLKHSIRVVLLASLLLNVLALAIPVFVMTVYDRVLATHSLTTLYYLSVGAVVVLAMDAIFRELRTQTLTFSGARLDYIVSNAIFARILKLPAALTDPASVTAQVGRVRELERLRGTLTGPLVATSLDILFVPLAIMVIFAMAGPLGWVPILTAGLYVVLALALLPRLNAVVSGSGRSLNARNEFLLEAFEKLFSIRALGASGTWQRRFRVLSLDAAQAQQRAGNSGLVLTTAAQSLMSFSSLAMLAFGVHLVISGNITAGGLIASMMLSGRVLGPIQSVFSLATRASQIRNSVRQIDQLMKMTPEARHEQQKQIAPMIGEVAFERVTFRYGRSDPELSGVSFHVDPGDLVAVIGPNGAGKSTVLKMIAGLYQPQSGSVLVDGRNIRQLEHSSLTSSIAYVPQTPQLFANSIAENLRLGNPLVSEDRMWQALEDAGVAAEVEALPGQLHARFDVRRPVDFPHSMLTRLSLARAYVKDASIYLFDEPVNGLDFEGDFLFVNMLQTLRGRATIFLVTHRPGHSRIADKVLLLDKGTVRHFGPAEQVRDKLTKELM